MHNSAYNFIVSVDIGAPLHVLIGLHGLSNRGAATRRSLSRSNRMCLRSNMLCSQMTPFQLPSESMGMCLGNITLETNQPGLGEWGGGGP